MKMHHYAIVAALAVGLYVYGRQHGKDTDDDATNSAPPIEKGWWTFAGNWAGSL